MSAYRVPIVSGIAISLILIYISIIPVMIYQYRKYNGVLIKKNLVVFSFILYMITAWFMTILPLPSMDEVANMKDLVPNLTPFKFVRDFLEQSGFEFGNPKTWLSSLKSPSFYTVAFNLLLTLPFGVYLRKYFKFSFFKTLLFGLLLSLFYEITQYTGIYGIYPKAYRLADVDDLIVNTVGTVLGYLITPILGIFLPSVEKGVVNTKSEYASILRRGLALVVDFAIVNIFIDVFKLIFHIFGINVEIFHNAITIGLYLLYFIIMPLIYDGETFGMKLLKIKIISIKNGKLAFKQILIRTFILVGVLVILGILNTGLSKLEQSIATIILGLSIDGIVVLFYLYLFIMFLRKKRILFYDNISGTRVVVLSKTEN
ncbi:VanZ family protein [Anaerosphaera multitolerans]|uniref:VanZ family protein n=1 Tax=Anaerosphaera multitolerans TaxID=2487351 RepID=A0A437S625_9FIRM|nr:VanZ family protein [Anaerosphaera multitolerans]RVU54471.1 VanZ family protein [Anaerosphaera multitolerans]